MRLSIKKTASAEPSSRLSPRLAREPIFTRRTQLVGYEFRIGPRIGLESSFAEGEALGSFGGVFEAEGEAVVANGRLAFIRISTGALHARAFAGLPEQSTVLELGGETQADSATRAACQEARARGFRIALDDFSVTSPAADLAADVDFFKIDVTDPRLAEERARTIACFRPGGKALIATGISTTDHVETAAQEGFDCLQGYFICQPARAARRPLAPLQTTLLRLLPALNDEQLSTGALEDLIKHDSALCYQILRTVNSAALARRTTISSIQEALLLLGRDVVRRWASLWIVAGFGAASHGELIAMATARARMCELLALTASHDAAGGEAFLLGLCSLLDAILGCPIAEAIADLPLTEATRRAICGEPSPGRDLLDCVIAYERGNWAECDSAARRARVHTRVLPGAFLEALRWSREFV